MDAEDIKRLVAVAGFVFRGSVEHHAKGEAPTIPTDAGEAVAVRIEHVLRSAPVLRGVAGQEAVVISRHASALRQSRSPILFTQSISLGQQLLLRELDHIEATEVAIDFKDRGGMLMICRRTSPRRTRSSRSAIASMCQLGT